MQDRAARALTVAIGFLLCVMPRALAGDHRTFSAYFVGNSITDTIDARGLSAFASSRGKALAWGRHMIPGAPLSWIWDHPADGFHEEPYGTTPNSLGNYSWDVLCLQPFDRQLEGEQGDVPVASRYVELALRKNPDVQIYIYSRWPRQDHPEGGELTLDYPKKWLRAYTGKYDGTEETRDYFERLVTELRDKFRGRSRPILLVPVGDVLFELDRRMKIGEIPGFGGVRELYIDGIHFNNVGSFVVGTTFYATLFREDPRGLDVGPYQGIHDPKTDRMIEPALAKAIQECVWSVVSKHPLAGVAR